MLNISSVAVAPVPAQGPVAARVQPTTPARASEHVSPRSQGVGAPVAPAGEGSRTQVAYAPPALPPVNPTDQALRANMYDNSAAPERFNAQSHADLAASVLAQRQALEAAPSLQGFEQERVERARREQPAPKLEGQMPPPQPNPVDEARANQIRDLLPNVWSASRFAADQLIGDEAREAAQRRADLIAPQQPSPIERALEAAADSYQTTSSLPLPPSAGVNVDRLI
ncbi:MAG: hypothetical protein Q7T22_01360 [Serpentinimonas sp.]|nr:hypothetical protein [Serpentinimonas sp.]